MTVGEVKSSSISIPVPKSPERATHTTESGYFAKAVFVLTLISIVRIVIMTRLPLTGDEAYYWQWSQHLAWGYHDHPPLVGWLIRAASVFGRSAFWVRFPTLVLSYLTCILLFLLSENIWQSAKSAFRTSCLLVFIPIFSVCALAIFPDAPLVFSWALFLWGSWKWLSDENQWPWMGLALGLAGLSKLMGLFLLPSFMLFVVLTDKSKLSRTSFWKSILLAALLCAPFLFWNATHHFETFAYQAHQRVTRGVSFSPSLFLNYVSLQMVALSPLVFALIFFTLGMLFRKAAAGDVRARFLLLMALPIHLFFLTVSLFTRVGMHWALPGYLSILAAAPIWVEESARAGKRWAKTFFQLGLITSLAFTLFFFSLFLWPQVLVPWISSFGIQNRGINHGKTLNEKAMAEILGYRELGEQVKTELLQMEKSPLIPVFVFTDSYSLSSVISFYAQVDAKTLLFTSTGGDYDRWNHFEDFAGHDALYVDTQPIGSRQDIDQVLHRAFRSVEPLPPLTVKRGQVETDTFYFAHCVNLSHPEALRPHWPW